MNDDTGEEVDYSDRCWVRWESLEFDEFPDTESALDAIQDGGGSGVSGEIVEDFHEVLTSLAGVVSVNLRLELQRRGPYDLVASAWVPSRRAFCYLGVTFPEYGMSCIHWVSRRSPDREEVIRILDVTMLRELFLSEYTGDGWRRHCLKKVYSLIEDASSDGGPSAEDTVSELKAMREDVRRALSPHLF